MVADCIKDDFTTFLDRSLHRPYNGLEGCKDKSGHTVYGLRTFEHRNVLCDEDYHYYVRCVGRFRDLLASDEPKLFLMCKVNQPGSLNQTDEIMKLDRLLSERTRNHELVYIHHHQTDSFAYTTRREGNVCFINLQTSSQSNGIRLLDDEENERLNQIVMDCYRHYRN